MELQIVAFLLRYQPSIAAPTELGNAISSFLGPSSNLSLSEGCTFGSTALLDWIWESSCPSTAERTSGWSLTNFLRSDRHYYNWQFSKSLAVVARRGDLVILEWLFEHFSGCVVPVNAVELAAAYGHIELLKAMLERDAGSEYMYNRVAMDLDVDRGPYQSIPEMPVHWNGTGNCVSWGGRSVLHAIENGHLHVARWLSDRTPHKLNDHEMELVIRAALNAGAVDLAEVFLPAGRSIFDYVDACFHPNVIEIVLNATWQQLNRNNAAVAVHHLARAGRLDLIQQLMSRYSPPAMADEAWLQFWRLAMHEAIKRKDLPMLQWLLIHPTGQELVATAHGTNTCLGFVEVAASNGCLEIMPYLVDRGIASGYEAALVQAVYTGQLGAVKWLLPHITKLTELDAHNLMDDAAKYGHLDILQFFHGTTPSASSPKRRQNEQQNAVGLVFPGGLKRDHAYDHVDTLELIRSKGCSSQALNFAAAHGYLEVVQWLHANRIEGCTTFAMDNAAANGYLEVVEWLQVHRSEGCTTQAMDLAAQNGHLAIVKWLRCNRSEGCTFKAIEKAISNGHLQVANWIRTHYPDHYPAMVGKSICTDNMLEVLLFLHVHYPYVFTIWFCARLQRMHVSRNGEGNESFAIEWLETHHSDR